MSNLNLDALIPREDFESTDAEASFTDTIEKIHIAYLEVKNPIYQLLRKPDFQRETADWNKAKVSEFIKSVMEGDLIPSIILWKSKDNLIFVIDGAHRLSALIAWVHDDYGDGPISQSFFMQNIPTDQKAKAESTRKFINKNLGAYKNLRWALDNYEKADAEQLKKARKIATLAIDIQWVKGGAEKAESSFFKINQQAAKIDPTELKLLKARKKPNALAARAMIRAGTGHKYWSKFSKESQEKIEELASNINQLLFVPEYATPIKTLDLPVAGRSYSATTLPLVFDLVNISNDFTEKDEIFDDVDGDSTIKSLLNTQKIMNRISGTHPSCLGMFAAIYFYSSTGRFQPSSFLAVVEMVKNMEIKNNFSEFLKVRALMEKFLSKHKTFVNQITNKHGSGVKSYKKIFEYYIYLQELIAAGKNEQEIIQSFSENDIYKYLNPNESDIYETNAKDFSTGIKSASFLREALESALECKICGAYINRNSITFDHKIRKQDGGMGNFENAQLAHPYCNTTEKN